MDSVLVIEDSRPMQRTLQRLFAADSLEVRIASDGVKGLESFRHSPPNVVVLDLTLPGLSGKELCRSIKAEMPHVPIVVLSANADVDDKVLLLELGADDYVTKPFSPKELLARVRRAMRRNVGIQKPKAANQTSSTAHDLLAFGDVEIDFTSMEAKRTGRPVSMTAQEFKLLRFLSHSPERVIPREELLNEVWGYQNYPSTRTVDNHILRLRQKLESDPTEPRHFLTVHGVGYKFIPGNGTMKKNEFAPRGD
jgi:DNA-binding response OmpR family regulator